MIKIETPDGSEISDTSPQRFPSAVSKAPRADELIDNTDFLREGHHRLYGRPWILGRFHFDALVSHGLRPDHRFLDLGCGAGRVGSWVADYLNPDHYFGIDAHLLALRAFADYEAVFHGLGPKRPRLMLSNRFEVEAFGVRFDVVLDSYVLPHLTPELIDRALTSAANCCNDGARFFSNSPRLDGAQMSRAGWWLLEKFQTSYPMFEPLNVQSQDNWSVYERRS